jgi:hypothetical protein
MCGGQGVKLQTNHEGASQRHANWDPSLEFRDPVMYRHVQPQSDWLGQAPLQQQGMQPPQEWSGSNGQGPTIYSDFHDEYE